MRVSSLGGIYDNIQGSIMTVGSIVSSKLIHTMLRRYEIRGGGGGSIFFGGVHGSSS